MTSWLQSTYGQQPRATTCWVFPLKTRNRVGLQRRECWPFVAFHVTPTLQRLQGAEFLAALVRQPHVKRSEVLARRPV
jgi:hypothetical protein